MRKATLVFVKSFLEVPTFKDTHSIDIEFDLPERFDGDQVHLMGARVYNIESKTTMPAGDSNALIMDYKDFQNLMGKLLTYVDATFSDPEQRKAHKDIVKNTLWSIEREMRDRAIQSVDAHTGEKTKTVQLG